jgi:hypothetical protein
MVVLWKKNEAVVTSLTPQIAEYIWRWGVAGSQLFFDYPHTYFSGRVKWRILLSECSTTPNTLWISFGDITAEKAPAATQRP